MAHWKKGFSTRYLSAEELDTPIIATIARVAMEEISFGGQDAELRKKPVLHFREGQGKAVIMNVTRCQQLSEITGSDDTDRWVGVTVQLTKGWTRFQGKRVASVDIGAAPTPATAARPVDDDIPF